MKFIPTHFVSSEIHLQNPHLLLRKRRLPLPFCHLQLECVPVSSDGRSLCNCLLYSGYGQKCVPWALLSCNQVARSLVKYLAGRSTRTGHKGLWVDQLTGCSTKEQRPLGKRVGRCFCFLVVEISGRISAVGLCGLFAKGKKGLNKRIKNI